jgi:hypothetical protein
MKIGLLTFHTAANFGASLQAYALQEFLVSRGYDAEYLDYQNHHRRMIYDMPYHIKECFKAGKIVEATTYLLGLPIMNIRKRKFDKFSDKYLRLSPKTYYSPEALKPTNGQYDKFVVGSDQVWNPRNNGRDVAYLLNFVEDKTKAISYSSSFGVLSIPDDIKSDYVNCLNGIHDLSTREQSGVKLIKELTGRDAKLVLDPVFLLSKEQWQELAASTPIKGRFLFSYTNRKDQMSKFLKTTGYKMDGLKHHKLSRFTTIGDFVNPAVKVKYDMSPTEFLANVNGAELVVSASFHCISLSIILNKPFVCFLTGDEGKDERLKTLLTHFDLFDRVYREDMTLADVMKPIDWSRVNGTKEEIRSDSINFLLNAINSIAE